MYPDLSALKNAVHYLFSLYEVDRKMFLSHCVLPSNIKICVLYRLSELMRNRKVVMRMIENEKLLMIRVNMIQLLGRNDLSNNEHCKNERE